MVTARDFFIKQGLKEAQIEDYIRQKFPAGDYSHMLIQRTPLGIKIVIYTNKPGRIIGKGGRVINEMTESIKEKFALENPEIEVRGIENPDLDSHIVAKQIASALAKGFNYKKIGNLAMRRIMDARAVGAQIIIAGKISGSKASRAKFMEGYVKLAGNPATELVDIAYETVLTKPGIIGVTVKIMARDVEAEAKKAEEEEAKKLAEEKPALIEELKKEEKPAEEEGKKPETKTMPKEHGETMQKKAKAKPGDKGKAKKKNGG